MRREMMRMSAADALALLDDAPYMHLASTRADGSPVLRTLHGVTVDNMLCFHGSPVGEKCGLVGRQAIVSCEEVIAEVPSYFSDPFMACPATTLYRSVQVHGVLVAVEEHAVKARAMQALMERYQPQGGYRPIEADDPQYRKEVRGLAVWGVPLDRVDGKAKLMQNRGTAAVAELISKLWERGEPRDAKAVELVLLANPKVPRPDWLLGPAMTTLHPWVDRRHLRETASLLQDQYWNEGRFDVEALASAHERSACWVVARREDGAIVGTARAVSDGVKFGYIGDVTVHESHRGRGIGHALLALLLRHPALRRVARVELATRDAVRWYERFGFVTLAEEPQGGHTRYRMARLRRPSSTDERRRAQADASHLG